MTWTNSVSYKPGDKVSATVKGPAGLRRIWALFLYRIGLGPRPHSKEGEQVVFECVGKSSRG